MLVVRDTGSLVWAILAAMAVGAAVAFVVVFSSIALKLNQVAVGFILTVLCADLAIFLGKPHFNQPGKEIPAVPIPLFEDIPFLGPVLFRHNLLIYFSMILIFLVWFYIYRTRPGLTLRSIGEQPEAAFVRGTAVNRLRYLYTLARRIAGRAGRGDLFAVGQTGLERGPERGGLDRAGDCDLRVVGAGRGWRWARI